MKVEPSRLTSIAMFNLDYIALNHVLSPIDKGMAGCFIGLEMSHRAPGTRELLAESDRYRNTWRDVKNHISPLDTTRNKLSQYWSQHFGTNEIFSIRLEKVRRIPADGRITVFRNR